MGLKQCTKDTPAERNPETWEHPDAEIQPGLGGDDTIVYKCPNCGHAWGEMEDYGELPYNDGMADFKDGEDYP